MLDSTSLEDRQHIREIVLHVKQANTGLTIPIAPLVLLAKRANINRLREVPVAPIAPQGNISPPPARLAALPAKPVSTVTVKRMCEMDHGCDRDVYERHRFAEPHIFLLA